ncbi:MAG: hypothetical protein QXQ40_00080 [Candidatus Aenigmatarchaeota archaeon]
MVKEKKITREDIERATLELGPTLLRIYESDKGLQDYVKAYEESLKKKRVDYIKLDGHIYRIEHVGRDPLTGGEMGIIFTILREDGKIGEVPLTEHPIYISGVLNSIKKYAKEKKKEEIIKANKEIFKKYNID